MGYFSPLCQLQLSISQNRLVQLVPVLLECITLYTGDFELSSPILAQWLARTSGQIRHRLNAITTCPLLARLLLAHLKPLYLANCKQRHAFAQYKSATLCQALGVTYSFQDVVLIYWPRPNVNFCCVPTSFLWIIACFWSTLTAYTLPSILCLARRTLPKLPFPITFKKSKSLGRALHKEMKHYHK